MDKATNRPAVASDAGTQADFSGVPTEAGWFTVGLRSWQGQPPPREAVTFAGISFPLFAKDENPTISQDTIEYNQRRRGQRIFLDEEDLGRLKAAMGGKIVRTRSAKAGRYVILAKGSKAGARKLKGDLPLERFLYITPDIEPEAAAAQAEEDVPEALG